VGIPSTNLENERVLSKWCKWVENFIAGGSVAIKVNDDIDHYF
jgi:hypothetical protein